MALILTVTKVSVKKKMDQLFSITLNLKVHDDVLVQDVINQDFTKDSPKSAAPSAVEDYFKKVMQEAIDAYKSEQNIHNHALLDAAVTNIKNGLVV